MINLISEEASIIRNRLPFLCIDRPNLTNSD